MDMINQDIFVIDENGDMSGHSINTNETICRYGESSSNKYDSTYASTFCNNFIEFATKQFYIMENQLGAQYGVRLN
jgi:hypothetical protein